MPSLVAGKSWAVLIGISRYPRSEGELPALPALPAVQANVADLESCLINPEIVGFPRAHTISMVDIDQPSTLAERIAETAKKASDTLLVYYAGHGLIGTNRELRLATSHTRQSVLDFSSLSIESIKQAIRESPAKKKILILDCCFSGRAFDDIMSVERHLVQASLEVEGTYALASTPGTKAAIAPSGERYTAFTGELISVLEGGIEGANVELSLEVIYRELKKRLLEAGFPEPQRVNLASVQDFYLAFNRAQRLDLAQRVARLEEKVSSLTVYVKENRDKSVATIGLTARRILLALVICLLALGPPALQIIASSTIDYSSYSGYSQPEFFFALLGIMALPIVIGSSAVVAEIYPESKSAKFFDAMLGWLSPKVVFWVSVIAACGVLFVSIYLPGSYSEFY